jgi:hypothetical protein
MDANRREFNTGDSPSRDSCLPCSYSRLFVSIRGSKTKSCAGRSAASSRCPSQHAALSASRICIQARKDKREPRMGANRRECNTGDSPSRDSCLPCSYSRLFVSIRGSKTKSCSGRSAESSWCPRQLAALSASRNSIQARIGQERTANGRESTRMKHRGQLIQRLVSSLTLFASIRVHSRFKNKLVLALRP